MTITVSTTVDIHATPQAVWTALTDFGSYPAWNPFMDRVEGVADVGSKLVVHMQPQGGRGMTFKPTVVAADPGRELRWLGKLGPGGLFDGEHSFVLSGNDDGTTRLTHSERFSGILVSLLQGTVTGSRRGFEAFNDALRSRVEGPRAA